MSRARYSPLARRDLDEISEQIAAENLDAAIAFCLAVEDAAEKLSTFPGMGAHRDFARAQLANLRSWPIKGFPHYLIFYSQSVGGIEILRILHGARDIESLFRSL